MAPPWNGALHPRAAKGASNGGQFAAGSGSSSASTAASKKPTAKKAAPVTVKTKGKLTFAEQAVLRAGAAQGKVKLTANQAKQLHAAHVAHLEHLQHVGAHPVTKKTATAKPKSIPAAKKTVAAAKKPAVTQTAPNPVMSRL